MKLEDEDGRGTDSERRAEISWQLMDDNGDQRLRARGKRRKQMKNEINGQNR